MLGAQSAVLLIAKPLTGSSLSRYRPAPFALGGHGEGRLL